MNSNFDITIIGSGILSAKIALLAAKQGLKVCLLSENDFGNIAAFNKIDIVDETNIVYENYANNFIPVDLINIDIQNSTFTKYYKQFLSKITKAKFKNYDNLIETEPQLKNTDIGYATSTKVYKYDYARVCIDTVLTAQEYGAKIFNYVNIKSVEYEFINFNYENFEYKISTKLIIDLRKANKQITNNFFTIPRYKLELTNTILLNEKDYRIQLIPYFSVVIVKFDSVITTSKVLQIINNTLSKQISEKEILDFWNENKSVGKVSVNENVLCLEESFVYGESTAINEVLSFISKKLNIKKLASFEVELYNNFTFEKRKTVIYEQVDKTFREVQQTNISPNEFTKLYYRYGSKFDIVIEKAYDFYADKNNRKDAWLMAQIWYAKEYEMAKNIDDFIYRRVNIYFSNYFDNELKQKIKKYFVKF